MTYQSTTSIASLYGIHFFDPVNPLLFFLDPPRSYSWLPCNLDRYQDPRHTMFCTPHGETSWFSLLDAHHRCSKTLRCSTQFCQPAGIPMRNRMIILTVQTNCHLCCRRLLKSRSLASTWKSTMRQYWTLIHESVNPWAVFPSENTRDLTWLDLNRPWQANALYHQS